MLNILFQPKINEQSLSLFSSWIDDDDEDAGTGEIIPQTENKSIAGNNI